MTEATWHTHFLNTNSSENTKEPMKPQNRNRNTLDAVALCHLARGLAKEVAGLEVLTT